MMKGTGPYKELLAADPDVVVIMLGSNAGDFKKNHAPCPTLT